MTLFCGINLGHDAGLCFCDERGLTLFELERLIDSKHACGAQPGADVAMEGVFAQFCDDVEHLAFCDYFTPRTQILPPEVRKHSERKHSAGAYSGLEVIGSTSFLQRKAIPTSVVRHHYAHAASAYYTSQFNSALILSLDGIGSDDDCGLICVGELNVIKPELVFKAFYGPRFGLLYEATTCSIFGSQFDTGKLMGMAAFGKIRPEFVDVFRLLLAGNLFRRQYPQLLDVVDTSLLPTINHSGVRYAYGEQYGDYFGRAIADRALSVYDAYAYALPDAIGNEILDLRPDSQTAFDIAATVQFVFETELVRFISGLRKIYPHRVLCFAGGCALNINANAKLLEHVGYDDIYIPSCCNDSGIAVGAALASFYAMKNYDGRILTESTPLSFCGPHIQGELPSEQELTSLGITLQRYDSLDLLLDDVARCLTEGQVLAWMDGRMETGPRALGHRSLLASPLQVGMRRKVSEEIKGREWFRPIAPIVPFDDTGNWFSGPTAKCDAMLFAAKGNGTLPEVTHADGSARLQTIFPQTNPALYFLLKKFGELNQCPVLMNTSLNGKGKPIINKISSAVNFLAGGGTSGLVLVEQLSFLRKRSITC